MEQVKIGQDTREYDRIIIAQNDRILKVYQPLIDEYHALNISTLETEDLDAFFYSPKSFFVTLLTKDEPLTLGGVKLQADKVYEFMERPAGLDAFVEKLINYKIDAEKKGFKSEYLGNLEPYELVNNKLQLTAEYKEETEYNTTYFAETETQLKAFNLINSIIENIEEFNTIWKDEPLVIDNDKLLRIGLHGSNRNKMFVNIDQLLRYTK
ncbi:hypothetical protein ACTS9E_14535 [Empedobacter brevis]